jgi:CubicO group peptidase (beta-lactamase class C family)
VTPSTDLVRAAAEDVLRAIRADPAFSRTSHLRIELDGEVVFDRHLLGPQTGDVFSVTKSVLATLVGLAVADGLLPDLDAAVDDWVPTAGTPSAGVTWRHLLTMQRGVQVGGEFDSDEVMARPAGWLDRWLAAPRIEPPGTRFRYDDGATYLLGAALHAVVGDLYGYAEQRLFQPLGIGRPDWLRGPEGFVHGGAHLRLTAADLARLGRLWLGLESGVRIDPDLRREMITPSSSGGPPEHTAYGYLMWIGDGYFFAGGWAGQYVVCVPASRAVVVVTGDPQFTFGPPVSDAMPSGWRPALDLVRAHLLPLLLP